MSGKNTHVELVRDIKDAVSTRASINLPSPGRVLRLPVPGTDLFAIEASSSPTVFGYDELAGAIRASGEWAVAGTRDPSSAEALAIEVVLHLATEIFGAAATVDAVAVADVEIEGAADAILEIRYAAPESEAELIAQHEEFTRRFVSEVPVEIRRAYSVIPIPLDADHAV